MRNKILLFAALCFMGFSMNAQSLKTPEMEPLAYQIGKWLTKDIKKGKDGRRYQFAHKLEWFDRNQRIAKLTIFGVYEDGEERLYWEGFKNWDPTENKILYVGMSLDGRSSRGYVEVVNDKVIKTVYEGVSPTGKKVYIEDVATQEDSEHFTTVTNLKFEGDNEWKVVNTDHWVKVDSQKFNDKLK